MNLRGRLYNLLDLPQRQTTGEGTIVDYKYAFDGSKLQEKVTAGASVTLRDFQVSSFMRGSRQYFDRQLGRKSGK